MNKCFLTQKKHVLFLAAVRMFQIQKAANTTSIEYTLFNDQRLPSRIFLLQVETARFVGDYTLNPWYFDFSNYQEVKFVIVALFLQLTTTHQLL